jgi:6-pyruvoyl-tetrahydropterin synthase
LDVQTIARRHIGASHALPTEPGCERQHGHSYLVTGGKQLQEELDRLLVEIHHKDLDTMMPGSITTPEGIAAWIVERLSQRVDRLTRVEIQELDTFRSGVALRKLR